jgi:hypothetical protein
MKYEWTDRILFVLHSFLWLRVNAKVTDIFAYLSMGVNDTYFKWLWTFSTTTGAFKIILLSHLCFPVLHAEQDFVICSRFSEKGYR